MFVVEQFTNKFYLLLIYCCCEICLWEMFHESQALLFVYVCGLFHESHPLFFHGKKTPSLGGGGDFEYQAGVNE